MGAGRVRGWRLGGTGRSDIEAVRQTANRTGRRLDGDVIEDSVLEGEVYTVIEENFQFTLRRVKDGLRFVCKERVSWTKSHDRSWTFLLSIRDRERLRRAPVSQVAVEIWCNKGLVLVTIEKSVWYNNGLPPAILPSPWHAVIARDVVKPAVYGYRTTWYSLYGNTKHQGGFSPHRMGKLVISDSAYLDSAPLEGSPCRAWG